MQTRNAALDAKDIRAIVPSLGFGPFQDVRSRRSIADLFPKSRRCGLYALHFANGEGYVGRSIDVVRRYAGHLANHDDISELALKPLSLEKQIEDESGIIEACEAAGVQLRNIQFASVVLGETDLDLVMVPSEQQAWLASGKAKPAVVGDRVDDPNLRRKYKKKFDELRREPHWPALRQILRAYAASCIPAPAKTELSFWSVSCLPGVHAGYARIYVRVNINAQEVFGSFLDDGSLACAFQVRKSLVHMSDPRWPSWVEFDLFRYVPGGQDQVRLIARNARPGHILRFLEVPAFRAASKDFNLNLMRKGPNLHARSHCFDLADAMLSG